MTKYYGKNYSIILPQNWEYESNSSCVTFYNSEKGIFMQISEYSKNEMISSELILDLLNIKPTKHNNQEQTYGNNKSISYNSKKEISFDGELCIYRDKYFLFITYFYIKKADFSDIEYVISSIDFKNNSNKR